MSNKIVGAILLSAAGLVVAVGAVGSQIAFAIVRGMFSMSRVSGVVPPGPEQATLHEMVLVAAAVLAAFGLFFLYQGRRFD